MTTALLYFLAFCSGFAALTYQVAWSRMLSLTFGSSTLAVSAVVAGFMGGMGIGAWLYHRLGARVGSAIRAYAGLELGIGVAAGCLTLLLVPLPQAFAAVASHLPAGLAMSVLRVLTVFVLLLFPSALMGATYPALCQALLHTARDVDRRLGWIYGLNTLGAATGALVAGFVLVEYFGSHGSVVIANAINVSVGMCAILLSRASQFTAVGGASQQTDESLPSELPSWIPGLVLFGAGFATLGYEIVWFRALHYLLGNGTYVLSTALVIFLVGLGLGSFLYVPAVRWGRPAWSLGFAQIAVALLAIVAIGSEQYILTSPELSDRFSAWSRPLMDTSWRVRLTMGFGIATAIMLPATICMGLTFPLASRLFLGSMQELSARVGLAYLLSNLGGILGAIVAAMWMLPSLGSVGSTKLLAGINLALAFIVLSRMPARAGRLVALAASAVVILLALGLPARLAFHTLHHQYPTMKFGMPFEEESELGIVQVYEVIAQRNASAMSIDGTVIGVDKGWNVELYMKQRLLAHLPMLLDRNIRHTLNLGVATGATVNALSLYDWVETLDAVEINPAVVRASSHFLDSAVFDDPRATLYVEDAVHFLLRSDGEYDLIISDAKQHVRFGGNAKILSTEFYRSAMEALDECGLFVQFLPLAYTPTAIRLILRTFRSVFPEMELFLDAPNTLLTVGSRCPLAGRRRPSVEELRTSGLERELKEMLPSDMLALLSLWIASGDELGRELGDGPINSWDRLPLEFLSYRMPQPQPVIAHASLAMMMHPRQDNPAKLQRFVDREAFDTFWEINEAYLMWLDYDFLRADRAVRGILRRHPFHPFARRAHATTRMRFPDPKRSLEEIVW